MVKLVSVSGLVQYVRDVEETAKFYESLGFTVAKRDKGIATIRLNWFWIDFVQIDSEEKAEEFQAEANKNDKGAGIFVNVSVDSVDEFYKSVIGKGMNPSSEPRDWPWGRREFVLRDPDGYKLVFFQKTK